MSEEARAHALRLLDKRDYSRKLLLDKLTDRGISPADAEETVDRLCAAGLVDDRRYAGLVVRHYAAKGYGERRIRDELYRRGVPKELWDEALTEMPEQDDTLERLLRSKLGSKEPTRENLSRVTAALQRRGYGYGEIREAMERLRIEEDYGRNEF